MVSTIAVGNEIRMRFRLKINGVTQTLIASKLHIDDQYYFDLATPYDIVATYDGVSMKLYSNGELIGVKVAGGVITSSFVGDTHIGSNDGENEKFWAGRIQSVEVYDVALTQEQINQL